MNRRPEGKVAIVTGGASGMGRATVQKFVREGAKVVNAICPGGIATPIFAGPLALTGNEDYAALVRLFLARGQPIPRSGEPEDIANAACFFSPATKRPSFPVMHWWWMAA